jgi:hypothetical protein
MHRLLLGLQSEFLTPQSCSRRKKTEGEFDQSTLYACRKYHNETLLYSYYAVIKKREKNRIKCPSGMW